MVGQEISYNKNVNIYSDNFRRTIGLEFLQKAYNSKSIRFIVAAKYRTTLQTYSTPFLYSLFKMFNFEDYDQAYTIYQFFCMACMVFAILVFSKLLRYPFVVSMLFLVFFVSYFEPYLSDLRVANVNQVQLGFLVLFLWIQSKNDWKFRDFLGGNILGILVMFKPNLVFVLLFLSIFWLISGQYKKLILECFGLIVSVILAVILSSVIFGSPQCWLDWFKEIILIPSDIIPVSLGNFSLIRLISDSTHVNITKYLPIVLVSITMLFIWPKRNIISHSSNSLFGEIFIVGMGCLTYLLSSPLVWLHYYILVIPITMFIFRPADNINFEIKEYREIVGILSVFSVMLYIVSLLIFLGVKSANHAAVFTILATFILYILAIRELKFIV